MTGWYWVAPLLGSLLAALVAFLFIGVPCFLAGAWWQKEGRR